MNLILNVNRELHSVKGSSDGEAKVHAAIAEAMAQIQEQARTNAERAKKGLSLLPYKSVIKDEYGKELVTIKETKNLQEIRNEYKKKQQETSYENQEQALLQAMDEVGNSTKKEVEFKEDLKKTLNSALFVTDANLSPGQVQILDFFGDENGLFNSINFKEAISSKCIKELIDLPNPKTGKPPKNFEQLMQNLVSINRIFKENENRDNYIEVARNYVNIRYNRIIPEQFKADFKERGGLKKILSKFEIEEEKKNKINSLDFEVSEKNFKKLFQSFINLNQFKNKPQLLANYLMKRVPPENQKNFTKWMNSIGCKDPVSTLKVFYKWEAELTENKDNSKDKGITPKGLRGE